VASAASADASAAETPAAVTNVPESKVAAVTPVEKASAPQAETSSAAKAEARASEKTPATADAQTKASSKEVGTKSDDQWVAQLPSGSYVLQLSAMDTEEEMRAFKRSNPAYAKARIMQAPKKGSNKRYFILVAGPFESKAEADAYMQTSPLLAKGWLRTAKSMKTQFGKA
jgi:septal ring-binding cell division protein DamX